MTTRERVDPERKRTIFDRTRGKCHICHKKLAFKNHGTFGARGAWHVEHSVAIANGGTNHGNNLYAACISCNLEKCTSASRTARAWAGTHRAPLPAHKYAEAKSNSAFTGAAIGATLGAVIAGPPGAILISFLALAFGYETNPEK
jgi:hypothetical protein